MNNLQVLLGMFVLIELQICSVWTQTDKMTPNECDAAPGNTLYLGDKWLFRLNIRLKYVPSLWPAIIINPRSDCCNLQKTLWKSIRKLFFGGAKCLKFLLKDDEPEKNCSIKNIYKRLNWVNAEWMNKTFCFSNLKKIPKYYEHRHPSLTDVIIGVITCMVGWRN